MTPHATHEVFSPGPPLTDPSMSGNVANVAISNSALLGSASNKPAAAKPARHAVTPVDLTRPSPVKFTNQRPDQFPIKPEPIPHDVAAAMKHKMLSLEKLKDLHSDLECKNPKLFLDPIVVARFTTNVC